MRDQHVHVAQRLRAVTVQQRLGGALDHVRRGLVRRDVVPVGRRLEHDVVGQFVGLCVAGEVVGADFVVR
jgi:hypothetical protein